MDPRAAQPSALACRNWNEGTAAPEWEIPPSQPLALTLGMWIPAGAEPRAWMGRDHRTGAGAGFGGARSNTAADGRLSTAGLAALSPREPPCSRARPRGHPSGRLGAAPEWRGQPQEPRWGRPCTPRDQPPPPTAPTGGPGSPRSREAGGRPAHARCLVLQGPAGPPRPVPSRPAGAAPGRAGHLKGGGGRRGWAAPRAALSP